MTRILNLAVMSIKVKCKQTPDHPAAMKLCPVQFEVSVCTEPTVRKNAKVATKLTFSRNCSATEF
jgi:hypothetical protein